MDHRDETGFHGEAREPEEHAMPEAVMQADRPSSPTPSPRVNAPERSHDSWWLVALLWPIWRLFLPLYFRYQIVGRERLPRSGPVIVAPTHRSRWDPILLARITRRRMRFLASRDEFIGLQGWLMRHLGTFAVNTRRPSPASLKHCREILLAGRPLVIFPEGALFYSPPNQAHPIKPGTAWLALNVQDDMPDSTLTIVPVRMIYSDRFPKFRTRAQVVLQEPIRLDAYRDLPRKEAIAKLTADLQRGLGDEVNTSLAERAPDRPWSS
jgi:1-acyl-sn-glycerol-3-phosphate acyltransferase